MSIDLLVQESAKANSMVSFFCVEVKEKYSALLSGSALISIEQIGEETNLIVVNTLYSGKSSSRDVH